MHVRFPALALPLLLPLFGAGCHQKTALPPVAVWTLAGSYPVGVSAFTLAAGDLNGDKKQDLAVTTYSLETIRVLLGRGDGTFLLQPEIHVAGHHNGIVISDITGDGIPDLVVRSDDARMEMENIWHSLLIGDGRGGFSPSFPRMSSKVGEPLFEFKGRGFRLVDLNGDRWPDQVLESRSPRVFLNPFSKSGAIEIHLSDTHGSWKKVGMYKSGEWPRGIGIGDLNGDGQLDIVTANYASNSLSFLLGKGHGKFEKKADLITGDRPTDVDIADFNGDGRADLAVTLWGEGTVRVYLNQPLENP